MTGWMPMVIALAILPGSAAGRWVGGDGVLDVTDFVDTDGRSYDYVRVAGDSAVVSVDPGKTVRITFLDLNDDLVVVEFSGGGQVSVSLENAGPLVPASKYNLPHLVYGKGLADVRVRDPDATTRLAIYAIGRSSTTDQSVLRDDVTYDGMADIRSVRAFFYSSPSVPFGRLDAANTVFSAAEGYAGISAWGVNFVEPVVIGELAAREAAMPVLVCGAADIRVAGGSLLQPNGQPVYDHGLASVGFVAGTDAHGNVRPAQSNQAQFSCYGVGPPAPPPTNDAFANARLLSGDTGTIRGGNIDATGEAGEPRHWSQSGAEYSVWFSWQPTVSGEAVIDSSGSEFPTAVAAYAGSGLGALTKLGGSTLEPVRFNVSAGTTYHIALGGTGGGRAIYQLNYRAYVPPTITSQPASLRREPHETATFSVSGSGTEIAYQWYHAGEPIPGATEPVLTLSDLRPADAGEYQVRISSPHGIVWSAPATLDSDHAAPVITVAPQSATVMAGQSAVLSVVATGEAPLAYQWRRHGFPIPGAVGLSYAIASASRGDADEYDVVVYSGLTANVSPPATLRIRPASYPGAVAYNHSGALWFEDATRGSVEAIVPLADGKFYVAGNFTSAGDQRRWRVARFNADGSLDAGFVPPEFDDIVYAVAAQADGRVLVGGSFRQVGEETRSYLARLNPDGTLDRGFAVAAGGIVRHMAKDSLGRIYVSGSLYPFFGASTPNNLIRLTSTGSLDSSFSGGATGPIDKVVVQTDGSLLVHGSFDTIRRLTSSGAIDDTFPANLTSVKDFALQSNGQIVLVGTFTTVLGQARPAIARLNADGTLDATFAPRINGFVDAIGFSPDETLLLAGGFRSINGQLRVGLARLQQNGSLDARPLPALSGRVYSLAYGVDGTVLLGGVTESAGSSQMTMCALLVRLNPDDRLDSGFAPTFRTAGSVGALAHGPHGAIYVGGQFTHLNGAAVSRNLIRLGADGTLDAAFVPDPNGRVRALAVQGNGHLLVGGEFTAIGGQPRARLARLTAEGVLDPTLALAARRAVNCLAVQSDRRVLAAGNFDQFGGMQLAYLARVKIDGSLDSGYVPDTWLRDLSYEIRGMAIQPDGKTVVVGPFYHFGTGDRNLIARVGVDGTCDQSFAPVLDAFAGSVALQPDGRILVGGAFTTIGGQPSRGIARLNQDGTRDATFSGSALASGLVSTMLLQENGRVLVGGNFVTAGAAASTMVARLKADGSLDSTFGVQSPLRHIPYASTLLLAEGGQLWIGGAENSGYSLARLEPVAMPSITTQPASQNGIAGEGVTLSVEAASSPAPQYQWYFNGAPLAGATSATLRLDPLQPAAAGSYHVVVSNGAQTVTSAAAVVSCTIGPPAIGTPPADAVVTAGQPATFTVAASGFGTLTYQWRHDGWPIAGATGSSYSMAAVTMRDEGRYDVVVANGPGGSVTSESAALSVAPTRYPAQMKLDPTFAPVIEATGGTVNSIARQPDGKLVVGGSFSRINGVRRLNLARLNADGSVDPAFDPGTGPDAPVSKVLLQADGKVLLGGEFVAYDGASRGHLARVNADGSLDTGFATGTGTNNTVLALAIQADGKVLLGGWFSSYDGVNCGYLARVNVDGSFDATFNTGAGLLSGVMDLAVQSDGRVVAVGYFSRYAGITRDGVARLLPSGSLDLSFTPITASSFVAYCVMIQADGKILIGGDRSSGTLPSLLRLNPDGSRDGGFSPIELRDVKALAVQGDGKIIAGGAFGSYNGAPRDEIVRLTAVGALDATFNSGTTPDFQVNAIVLQPDGLPVIGGRSLDVEDSPRSALARLKTTGEPDPAFAGDVRRPGIVKTLVRQSDGRLLIGGYFDYVDGVRRKRIARLNADGSLEPDFNPSVALVNGVVGAGTDVRALVVQPDGKILVGGFFDRVGGLVRNRLARLLPDGSVDSTFDPGTGADSVVDVIGVQPDGKILLGGLFSSYAGVPRSCIARVNADASLDTAFNPGAGADSLVLSLALQLDGRALIGGWFSSYDGVSRPGMARIRSDGSLDPAFGGAGGFASSTQCFLTDPAGKIYVGGYDRVIRLKADGSVDSGYAGANLSAVGTLGAITRQADGRLLVGQATNSSSTPPPVGIARVNPDGSRDTTFGVAGLKEAHVGAIILLENGNLLVAGATTFAEGARQLGLARLIPIEPATIATPPQSQSISQGAGLTLHATPGGSAPFTYQWRLDGTAIPGATDSSYSVAAAQPSDAGNYTVVVTNAAGDATSEAAVVTVIAAGFGGTHDFVAAGYVAGATVTITNTITYAGELSALGWQVLLPDGWSFKSEGGAAGDLGPHVGDTDFLEWAWTTIPAGPITFTYTLNVPAGTTGPQAIAALMLPRQAGSPYTVLVKPDPLMIDRVSYHTADKDRDGRLSLNELLRVIELYNTRNGTVRTGAYAVDANNLEDGLTTAPARLPVAVVRLMKNHSADGNHDGKLGLNELLRVIELYNHRNGTVRTGQYHVQANTEDDFSPGP